MREPDIRYPRVYPPLPILFTSATAEFDALLDTIPSTDANDVWGKAVAGCLHTIDARLQDTAWSLMDEKLGLVRDPLTESYVGWRVCAARLLSLLQWASRSPVEPSSV